jgi:hypothetical protein
MFFGVKCGTPSVEKGNLPITDGYRKIFPAAFKQSPDQCCGKEIQRW